MKIKPETLLRSMLVLPFLMWVVALAFTSLLGALTFNMDPVPAFLNILIGVPAFYSVGIIGWGIPYTILAAGLFLWSLKKPARAMITAYVLSPIILAVLTLIEVSLIVFIPTEYSSFPSGGAEIFSTFMLSIIPSLGFGYLIVGLGYLIYKGMERMNWIKRENDLTAEPEEKTF